MNSRERENHDQYARSVTVEMVGSPISDLRTENERLRAELAAREWRTIESAPRDCRVLLWCEKPVFNGIHVVTGHWNADKFARKPRPYWTNDLEQIRGVLYTRATQPTHWMPLPLPLPPEPKP